MSDQPRKKRRIRGTGSIVLLGRNRWRIRVPDEANAADGKRNWVSEIVHGSKADAEGDCAAKLRQQLKEGTRCNDMGQTVGKFVGRWLVSRKSELGATTYERYQYILKNQIDREGEGYIGHFRLSEVTGEKLQLFYASLERNGGIERRGAKRLEKEAEKIRPLKSNTLHKVDVLLRLAFEQAVCWNRIPRNPCSDVKKPKVRVEPVMAWDKAMAQQIIDGTHDSEFHLAALLGIRCGLREGEVLGMRLRDVDLEAKVITVRESQVHTRDGFSTKPPKSNKPRTVAFGEEVAAALRRRRVVLAERCLGAGASAEEALLVSLADGSRWHPATFSKGWSQAMKELGISGKANFHVARHTAIALLLQAGINPKIVSDLAGHASVAFTLERYGHYVPNLQSEVVDKLEAYLGRQSA